MFVKNSLSYSTRTNALPDKTIATNPQVPQPEGRCGILHTQRYGNRLMSMRITLLFSMAVCSLMAANLTAQMHVPGPRYQPLQAESQSNTDPLVQPFIFDWDTQMFAPMDLSDVSDYEPQTGFFFTYDRVYMSMGRPNPIGPNAPAQHPRGSDMHWGNRYHGGFIGDDDKGFQFEYMNYGGIFFSAGIDSSVGDPFLTETNLDTFEFNRIFRQRLSNGSYLEPYFGARYTSLSDDTLEDVTAPVADRFVQKVTNSVIGGQIGARYTTYRGRWTVRTDSSVQAAYNSQRYVASDIQQPGLAFPTVFESTSEGSSFVPTVDLQLDIAYNLTRDIALRTTFGLMYMWDGINRANTTTSVLNPNSVLSPLVGVGGAQGVSDQYFFSGGLGFGIEWRR